jgi:hypothetical protein
VSQEQLVEFADALRRLLATAQSKAEGWLSQRKSIAQHLSQIRDTASHYLHELTGGAANIAVVVQQGRRGRPPGVRSKRGLGRPAGAGKKKRTMSAAARKNIGDRAASPLGEAEAGKRLDNPVSLIIGLNCWIRRNSSYTRVSYYGPWLQGPTPERLRNECRRPKGRRRHTAGDLRRI